MGVATLVSASPGLRSSVLKRNCLIMMSRCCLDQQQSSDTDCLDLLWGFLNRSPGTYIWTRACAPSVIINGMPWLNAFFPGPVSVSMYVSLFLLRHNSLTTHHSPSPTSARVPPLSSPDKPIISSSDRPSCCFIFVDFRWWWTDAQFQALAARTGYIST